MNKNKILIKEARNAMTRRNTYTMYIESQNVFGSQDIKNICQEWMVEANRNIKYLIAKKNYKNHNS